MKKLLYIVNQRLPSEKAYSIQIVKMCEAFLSAGLQVEIQCPTRNSKIGIDIFKYYNLPDKFSVSRIYSPDFYWPGSLDRFAFLIKNLISSIVLSINAVGKNADIIYSRDELPLLFLCFSKKQLVFEVHSFSPSRIFFYNIFRFRNIQLVCISESLKNRFIGYGYPKELILSASDGVDLELFNIDISKDEARKKLSLPAEKRIIIYSGHLFEWKGPQILAESAKKMPDNIFVFVGGTEKDRFDFEKKYGTYKNIIITGHRPHSDIPFYLKAADLLVLPNILGPEKSGEFTSPLKMFEYMASGRPVVASDLPILREVLNHKNSFLVPPGDAESLANAIDRILKDPGKMLEVARNAQDDAKRYSWHERAAKIIRFIDAK